MSNNKQKEAMDKLLEQLKEKGIQAKVMSAEDVHFLTLYYKKGFHRGFLIGSIVTAIAAAIITILL